MNEQQLTAIYNSIISYQEDSKYETISDVDLYHYAKGYLEALCDRDIITPKDKYEILSGIINAMLTHK